MSIFKFEERGTNVKTELLSGLVTFLTMAYIIFVNPAILSVAGVPFAAAVTATTLGSALICILMGVFTNRPLALAPGMGLNAAVAFTIVGVAQANVPWQVGMSVVFVEGTIILILVLTGLREAVMNAIPMNLKRAIGVGIGLFITFIGLNEGGIVVPDPNTLVTLGNFSQNYVWVTLLGLAAVLAFRAFKVKGDLLWAIAVATCFALIFGLTKLPPELLDHPDLSSFLAPFQIVNGSYAISQIFTLPLLVAVFSLMLTDFFDTMGTVIAVGEQAGFVVKDGRVPGIRKILTIDSLGAMFGGLFGASSITTYIESAAGVAEGGRTGLSPIVTGLLFVLATFLAPLIGMIGGGHAIPNAEHFGQFLSSGFQVPSSNYYVYPITAGVLIFVGFLMMGIVRDIEWNKFDEAVPSFLILIGIPLTYNISYGIGFGFISYAVLKVLSGKFREVHPLMYILAIAFTLAFIYSNYNYA